MNETHAASPHTLSVGEVARRSGVAVSTLHFYESKGLISAGRNAGNQRRYARDVLRYIAIIKVAQRVGIPLETVKQSLSGLPKEHPVSAAEWQRLTLGWREELDERITKLQRLRDDLDSCIGCGCLSMKDCPLRNPDDVLGQQGPGARILEAPVGTKKRAAAACRLPDERGD